MLTEHFSEKELRVEGADERIVTSARWLCENVLEPLRARFGPVTVTSGYRSPMANEATGGVTTSFHLYEGSRCAADVTCPADIVMVFDWLRLESRLPFDKVIIEFSLRGIPQIIHIQADPTLQRPRTAYLGKTHGKGSYTQVKCV